MRKWFYTLIVLGAIIFAGWVFVEYAVKPKIAHEVLSRVVSKYWTGSVDISGVEFDSANARLVGHYISLRDDVGREWLRIDKMTLRFDDWPSFRPTLHSVIIDGPTATLYADSGKLNLPWRAQQERQEKKQPIDVKLRAIEILNIWVELVRTDAGDVIPPTPIEKLHEVSIDGTASLRGNVKFNFNGKTRATAHLDGNVNLARLYVEDLRKLLGLEKLEENVKVQPLEITDLKTKRLSYDNGIIEVPEITGKIDNGEFWFSKFRLELIPREPTRFFTDFSFNHLPLRRIYDSYDPTRNVKYGWAAGKLEAMEYTAGKIEDLKVVGEVFLNDSDFDEMYVFKHINEHMKVDGKKIRNGSDVHLVFEVDDGIMNIKKGKVGNNLLAIHVIEGSRVDLRNKDLDMKVVVAMLGDLRNIPILGLLFRLNDKLNELNVTGPVHEPKISSAVLDHLDKSTKDFFSGLINTDGQLDEVTVEKGEGGESTIETKTPEKKKK